MNKRDLVASLIVSHGARVIINPRPRRRRAWASCSRWDSTCRAICSPLGFAYGVPLRENKQVCFPLSFRTYRYRKSTGLSSHL